MSIFIYAIMALFVIKLGIYVAFLCDNDFPYEITIKPYSAVINLFISLAVILWGCYLIFM
jgi:hypothetical protein